MLKISGRSSALASSHGVADAFLAVISASINCMRCIVLHEQVNLLNLITKISNIILHTTVGGQSARTGEDFIETWHKLRGNQTKSLIDESV